MGRRVKAEHYAPNSISFKGRHDPQRHRNAGTRWSARHSRRAAQRYGWTSHERHFVSQSPDSNRRSFTLETSQAAIRKRRGTAICATPVCSANWSREASCLRLTMNVRYVYGDDSGARSSRGNAGHHQAGLLHRSDSSGSPRPTLKTISFRTFKLEPPSPAVPAISGLTAKTSRGLARR